MIALAGGIPIAHAGHWIASLLYVAPVVVIVVALLWQSRREKRAKRPAPGATRDRSRERQAR